MSQLDLEGSQDQDQHISQSQSQDQDQPDIALETPASDVFVPPSIHHEALVSGASFTHFSDVPPDLLTKPVVLGVDEAGRGPVLGPMVYALFYLPIDLEKPLLKETYNFLDSKVLTPTVRSNLMRSLCTPGTDLASQCGWATNALSARDISANMMKPATYNLNAQAMDATVALIQGVLERGVNVQEIYIDTIGKPEVYQKKLERIFPTAKITVAKKADALYPCVSAASVAAKVTRDAALEVCWEAYRQAAATDNLPEDAANGWGSGYPSDARTTTWLKRNMHPVFGWGPECRFSWGTAKDMLEVKTSSAVRVDWPDDDDDDGMNISHYFAAAGQSAEEQDELANWFGRRVTEQVF